MAQICMRQSLVSGMTRCGEMAIVAAPPLPPPTGASTVGPGAAIGEAGGIGDVGEVARAATTAPAAGGGEVDGGEVDGGDVATGMGACPSDGTVSASAVLSI